VEYATLLNLKKTGKQLLPDEGNRYRKGNGIIRTLARVIYFPGGKTWVNAEGTDWVRSSKFAKKLEKKVGGGGGEREFALIHKSPFRAMSWLEASRFNQAAVRLEKSV